MDQTGIDVFNVFGADYYVDWRRVSRGASFFIPTTATPRQVLAALKPARDALDIDLAARPRCEHGIYGVRVWRMR